MTWHFQVGDKHHLMTLIERILNPDRQQVFVQRKSRHIERFRDRRDHSVTLIVLIAIEFDLFPNLRIKGSVLRNSSANQTS
jgi:hypothetical protein